NLLHVLQHSVNRRPVLWYSLLPLDLAVAGARQKTQNGIRPEFRVRLLGLVHHQQRNNAFSLCRLSAWYKSAFRKYFSTLLFHNSDNLFPKPASLVPNRCCFPSSGKYQVVPVESNLQNVDILY